MTTKSCLHIFAFSRVLYIELAGDGPGYITRTHPPTSSHSHTRLPHSRIPLPSSPRLASLHPGINFLLQVKQSYEAQKAADPFQFESS